MCPALPPSSDLDRTGARVLYFAYGSNLDREQMTQRCASAQPRFRARLEDYRLDFTHPSQRWSGCAADVLPCIGSTVWGGVYELAAADVALLDGFESGYERVQLEVCDDREARHIVLSYTVSAKQAAAPSAHYLEKIIRWGGHWALPDTYIEALRRIQHCSS